MARHRSRLAVTVAPAPSWSLMRWAICSACPSRRASMSCNESSTSPFSSGKLHRSVTTLRVNSTLPAPMNATFTMGSTIPPGPNLGTDSLHAPPGELRPGETPPAGPGYRGPHPAQVVGVTMVVGEGPLRDIAVQMIGRDVDLCALDGPLEQAPEVLDPVRVNITGHILAAGVVDRLVGVVSLHAVVAAVFVGEQRRSWLDPLVDVLLERRC